MTSDLDLIVDVWSRVKPFVTKKDRLDAADAIISVFDDHGLTDGLEDETGLDKELRAAIKSKYGLDEEEEYEEDDYE